ncbi:hypothetical protein PVAND_017451 [Polypedilum vanderplanki]|uniref:Uncharacterized protein n=1 Tax=Polypedilum vanderplanki TaxID=319348 RepID=A0A9J6BIB6_POLVA|nr:hypothetical protein PVAND_017451 [Polypedilum vanderplanki]
MNSICKKPQRQNSLNKKFHNECTQPLEKFSSSSKEIRSSSKNSSKLCIKPVANENECNKKKKNIKRKPRQSIEAEQSTQSETINENQKSNSFSQISHFSMVQIVTNRSNLKQSLKTFKSISKTAKITVIISKFNRVFLKKQQLTNRFDNFKNINSEILKQSSASVAERFMRSI